MLVAHYALQYAETNPRREHQYIHGARDSQKERIGIQYLRCACGPPGRIDSATCCHLPQHCCALLSTSVCKCVKLFDSHATVKAVGLFFMSLRYSLLASNNKSSDRQVPTDTRSNITVHIRDLQHSVDSRARLLPGAPVSSQQA